jgi:recombination protein RecR
MAVPASLVRLAEELERLPGVGRRTAERLAYHLLRVPEERALSLADAIRRARERVRPCSLCRCPTETEPCVVCADPARDRTLLLVVESARDLAAVENGGVFRGLYFVLGGRLAPMDGAGADSLDLEGLEARVRGGEVREVCLATNADLEGDGTALLVAQTLARAATDAAVRVTRLARGLPAGGQIEHQSSTVLAEAIEGRRPVA